MLCRLVALLAAVSLLPACGGDGFGYVAGQLTCDQIRTPFPVEAQTEGALLDDPDPRLDAIRDHHDGERLLEGNAAWVLVETPGQVLLGIGDPEWRGITKFGVVRLERNLLVWEVDWVEDRCFPHRVTDPPALDGRWGVVGEPGPEAVSFDLKVTYPGCSGGVTDIRWMHEPIVEYTQDSVLVGIWFEPLEGIHTCPGGRPITVTIDLEEPLGDRSIRNGSTVPSSPPLEYDPRSAFL